MNLAARAPKPRVPKLAFRSVPRHWFGGNAPLTHVVNGLNLLFPAGERFFVRSIHRHLERFEKEGRTELAARVRGFFGQEGRHAQVHERFFETLREQGYDVDGFLRWYERVAYEGVEKHMPSLMALSVTAALEHFTAILADDALDASSPLESAHPAMRQLLEWHALEELEHKSVAFDVLQAVNPSYALRMAGLAFGTTLLGGLWVVATRDLLAQDGVTVGRALRELADLRTTQDERARYVPTAILRRVFVRGVLQYARPGFHPDDVDHGPLVARTLARLEEEGVVAREGALAS